MFTLTNTRNLALAAGLASAALAFAASSSSQASQASFFACKGTQAKTEDCCHRFNPKPLWFKQNGLSCNTVVKCYKKYCYIRTTYLDFNGAKSKSKGRGGRGNGP